MITITLKRGKEESLLRFHPWVFSGAIANLPQEIEEGDTVRVVASDGRVLGVGHYEIGSIAVRMLSSDDIEISDDFYRERLAQAWALRERLGLIRPDNTTFRLVHGEGDFLPGCVVDVYGNTAVLQAHSPGMHYARHTIAKALTELDGAGIRNVYYKSETTLPYKARLDPVNDYIIGGFETNIAIENGLKFNIDWLKGQKTGFFVDQRDNRALTDANIELNFPGDTRHKSYAQDAFKYLADMPDGAYDLIILDPPAFAKHRSAIKNAMVGYRRINAAAFRKIAPGGILFTFSCSQAISREQFRLAVFTAAAQSGRKVRILHQLTQPADHPVNIYHPEGEYLKGLVLAVE